VIDVVVVWRRVMFSFSPLPTVPITRRGCEHSLRRYCSAWNTCVVPPPLPLLPPPAPSAPSPPLIAAATSLFTDDPAAYGDIAAEET